MIVPGHDPITAEESEKPALQKMEGVLNSSGRKGTSSYTRPLPKLVGPDGEEIELPLSVFQILRRVIDHMMHGRTISIVPINKELSTQEAADILNVSRPFLVSQLEAGAIPFIKVGTHRRIRLIDLMEYKKRRDEEMDRGLAEIIRITEDEDLYD
jgi:excisionase family DNA binding protein